MPLFLLAIAADIFDALERADKLWVIPLLIVGMLGIVIGLSVLWK